MTTAISKLDHFKLETKLGNGYVINAIYEWESTRRPKGLARWRQENLIGARAFGSVWLEKEEHGSQLWAVKRLQKYLLIETGFSRELLDLVTLENHNHLFVQYFGWYENKEDIFFAMEYIAYGDLSEFVRASAREITRQVLEGVNVLHRDRDLKPQNLLVASLEGLRKERRCSPTWSLGCLVHEPLTSQTPFLDDCSSETHTTSAASPPGIDMDFFFEYCQAETAFPTEALQSF